jgi:hypothetical protein
VQGLEAVDLTGCRMVTDRGLLHLAQLGGLKSITLTDTPISDAGLALVLPRLPRLESVGLAGTANVTAAAIPDLVRLRNLRSITLPPRADTVDVRVEIARRRPGCRVM